MEKMLEDFLKELCEFYKTDKTAPGIHLAWLPDKGTWYVSLHRFPTNLASRTIVSKGMEKELGASIAKCRDVWKAMCAINESKQ